MITHEELLELGWKYKFSRKTYNYPGSYGLFALEIDTDIRIYKKGDSNVLYNRVFVGQCPDKETLTLLMKLIGIKED